MAPKALLTGRVVVILLLEWFDLPTVYTGSAPTMFYEGCDWLKLACDRLRKTDGLSNQLKLVSAVTAN